jgi:hypothetical protein
MSEKTEPGTKDQAQKAVSPQVVIAASETVPFFYCNFISVDHTKYDVVMSFARIPNPLSETQIQPDGILPLEASVQVAISPELLPDLIEALDDQKRKYEERYGKIRSDRKDVDRKHH